MRRSTARGATGPRQEGETIFRVEAIPFRRVSKCPKESRERQWGVLGDKFGSEEGSLNAVDKAFCQGFDEGREGGRAEGTMPVGNKASCRQRLKREEGRRTRQGSGNIQRRGDGCERDRQMPKVGLCRLKTTEEGY
jgi:hypothetical protein